MNSYEIVKAGLHYGRPERLPVQFGSLGISDFAGSVAAEADDFGKTGADQWECVWSQTDVPNMGQVTGFPVKTLSDVDTFKVPDFNEDWRYENGAERIQAAKEAGKYVSANIFMILFERMHSLYPFADLMCDLLAEPEAMGVMADRIVEAQLTFIRNLHERFGTDIHGINMSEDWGTQTAAFVSFDLWMEFFYPRYRRLFDYMHECGYDVFVHSCGKVNEIIEGFINAGVNAMNLMQPRALGIEEIGNRYCRRVSFFTLADLQMTLPTGDPDRIDADVNDLMKHWATPDGGLILIDYGDDDAAIGLRGRQGLDTKLHMYRRFSEASETIYGKPLPEPVMP
jgi:hypothetical protein